MAVLAFYHGTSRHGLAADMERSCKSHLPHPLPGSVANRLPLCAAPAAEATTLLYHIPNGIGTSIFENAPFFGLSVQAAGPPYRRYTPARHAPITPESMNFTFPELV